MQHNPADDMYVSHVGELLASANNDQDDAVSTRERLRHARRAQVVGKYEASLATRLARDQSRSVVCNAYHQQMDVAPSEPGHTLVDNLMHGAYYDSHTRIPDIEKPHGLGRRVAGDSGSAPMTAAEPSPERIAAAEAAERNRQEAIRRAQAQLSPDVIMTRALPQDDSVDAFGRKKPASARPQHGPHGQQRDQTYDELFGQPDAPPPVGHVAPGPIPNFNMASPDAECRPCTAPQEWQKPMVTRLPPKNTDVAPLMVTRTTEPAPSTVKSRADDLLEIERQAALRTLAQQRPPSAGGEGPSPPVAVHQPHIAARVPARGVLPEAPEVKRPTTASARYRGRPTDTLSALF
jgi:hypothetical protein